MEAVRQYKEEKTGKPVEKLSPWETSYWAEKRRRELYAFDEEDLRPYYSVEKVMDGLFSIYSGLYGITVTPRKNGGRQTRGRNAGRRGGSLASGCAVL